MTNPTLPAVDVIVDETPMSGQFNMTMDAAMLQLGAVRDISVIRIYRWSVPTVTMGYFQGAAASLENPFPALPCVRRLSGGGAILHDNEFTYSCVLPACHPLRQDPSSLYGLMHASIIQVLKKSGVACCLRSEHVATQSSIGPNNDATQQSQEKPDEPFLCFLRQNANDIVHSTGVKIVGSAQRRRKGVTLQHGSILLSISPLTPTISGIEQLCPSFDRSTLEKNLAPALATAVGQNWQIRGYDEMELQAFHQIESQRARDAQ